MNPMRNAGFRRLYVGQAISSFGSRALWLASGMWVLQLTNSYTASGLVFLALGVPTLLGPVAGTLVDRATHRRRLVIAVNFAMATILLTLLMVRAPLRSARSCCGPPPLWSPLRSPVRPSPTAERWSQASVTSRACRRWLGRW